MSSAQSATDPWIGLELDGRYRLTKKLGEGGMGVVYKGEHVFIGKAVAIKILRAEFAQSQDLLARFQQEARSANLINHEHVVDITDSGKTPDNSAYFVMEYLEGYDLASLIEKGPIPYQRALPIVRQVCSALHAAHEAKIIHRDLKPENIFLSTQHEHPDFVKILDFGIAKITQEGAEKRTKAGMIFGTPEYMSPEQAGGGELDRRVDVYAIGVVLYEMLTGEVPFYDSSFMGVLRKHLMAPVPLLREANSNAPAQLDAIIQRAMAKQANERFQSMVEFWEAIEAIFPEFAPPKKARVENLHSPDGDSRRQRSISPPQGRVVASERGRSISPPPDANNQRRLSPVPQMASAYRGPSSNQQVAVAKPAVSGAYPTQKPKSAAPPSQQVKPVVSGAYKVQAKVNTTGGYAQQNKSKPPPATLLLSDPSSLAPRRPQPEYEDDMPTGAGESLEETLDLASFESKQAVPVASYRESAPTLDFASPSKKEVRSPQPTLDFTQEPTRVAKDILDLPPKESPSGVQEEPTRIAISASLMQPAVSLPAEKPLQEQATRMVSNPLESAAPVPFSSQAASPAPFSAAIAAEAPAAPKGLDAKNLKTESTAATTDDGDDKKKRLLLVGLAAGGTLLVAVLLYLFAFSGDSAQPEAPKTLVPAIPTDKKVEAPKSTPVVPTPNTTTDPKPADTKPPEVKPLPNVEQDFSIKVKAIPVFVKVFKGSKELGTAGEPITLRGKPGDKVKLTIKDDASEYKAATVEVILGETMETKTITLEKAPEEPEEPKKTPKKSTKTTTKTNTKTTTKTPKGGIIDPFKK